jgi:MATE family multidrug resistance protein
VAAVYVTMPGLLVSVFEGDRNPEDFAAVAAIVPTLLVCVAAYSVVDAVNVTFAFALRGAGDTRFVTLATFCLAWPIMVLPTFLVVWLGGSVYWAWWFATAHIFAMAACFYLRFRSGKWKAMRVIEPDLEGAR